MCLKPLPPHDFLASELGGLLQTVFVLIRNHATMSQVYRGERVGRVLKVISFFRQLLFVYNPAVRNHVQVSLLGQFFVSAVFVFF